MTETIMVALIGLLGVAITAGAGYLRLVVEKRKLAQADLEVRFQRAALSFPEFIEEWHEIHAEVLNLFKTTPIDRFLVLRAWNGHLEPRWTTAIFQMRTEDQVPISYVHFELDQDYVTRLREISTNQTVHLVTEKLPDGTSFKSVYEVEGVSESLVCHLLTLDGPIKGTKSHTYCSFATHDARGISDVTITRVKILVSRMKGLATTFEKQND